MRLTTGELERFVEGLAAEPELWRDLVRPSTDGRVYEQIWDDEVVNAWVICWSEDQDTGFHDHDRSDAAITVIEGHIRGAATPRVRSGLAPDRTRPHRGRSGRRDPSGSPRGSHAGGDDPRVLAAAAADWRLPDRPGRSARARVGLMPGGTAGGSGAELRLGRG